MKKYEELKKVSYQDVDFTGKYKLYNLFSLLSEIATDQAIEIGVWNNSMIDDYGWIVAKMQIEILNPIQYQEDVVFKTWPGLGSKVVFPRFYCIEDNFGNRRAEISSVWTLLDLKNRRITLPSRAGITFPTDVIEERFELPKDIEIHDDFNLVLSRKVVYSDLDTNQHVNNAKYIEWVCDLFPKEKYEEHYIKRLTIHFKKEITFGQQVDFYMNEEENTFTVYGKSNVNGDIFFIVEGDFS